MLSEIVGMDLGPPVQCGMRAGFEIARETAFMGSFHEKIIVVDDDLTNLVVIKHNLADEYDVFTVPSGEKLFKILERVTPDLILLDVEMPGLDGYAVIKRLKAAERTAGIPVVFLTAKAAPESELTGLDLGAVDYITKPFSRELLIKRIEMHLLLEKQKKELLHHRRSLEGQVSRQGKTIVELQNVILKTLAALVDRRDSVTGGHIDRTQRYLGLLVKFLLDHGIYAEELSTWDINLFVLSSQVHDVGKITIKDDILMKPGRLTPEEFAEMKRHCVSGVEIIKEIEKHTTENTFLQYAKVLAETHHEKWDGNGYPHGLSGSAIPLPGRLMAIVDVYDALTNLRPYKRAFTHEESTAIIRSGQGIHFDPLVVEVFLRHEKDFKTVTANGGPGYGLPVPVERAVA